jgi:ribosomal protein S12 methylthiotransferase accessory factor
MGGVTRAGGGAVIFGRALAGAANAGVRSRVAALGGRVHADSVLGMYLRLRAGGRAPVREWYLLFDLHRLVLFRATRAQQSPGCESVVRFLVDGYPAQPFDAFLDRARTEPYRFLYPLSALDILSVLRADAEPGSVSIAELATGEIRVSAAEAHPLTGADRPGSGSPAPAIPVAPSPLRRRVVGPDLRGGAAPRLAGLVSPAAGIVLGLTETVNHASLPYAVARLAWNGGRWEEMCSGKAVRPSDAVGGALFEALERYQVASMPAGERLVRGPWGAMRGRAVHPAALFFNGLGFDPDAGGEHEELHWTYALDLADGAGELVPAQEVWFDAARRLGEAAYVRTTTSGCALGTSREEAALFAVLEAVERDAYLIAWYLRRPCRRIDPSSVRSEDFQLLYRRWRYAYAGYEAFFFDIATDVAVPTVAAVAVRRVGEGPKTFHAAAARLSVHRACYVALKDLTGFNPRATPAGRERGTLLLRSPEEADGPDDHFHLYACDEAFARLGFLDLATGGGVDAAEVQRSAWIDPAGSVDLRQVLQELALRMAPLGVRLLVKDLTHPSLAARAQRCVRAVAPGLYPLWFGHAGRRFSVTPRLVRLARELCGRELASAHDVNLELHPFS